MPAFSLNDCSSIRLVNAASFFLCCLFFVSTRGFVLLHFFISCSFLFIFFYFFILQAQCARLHIASIISCPLLECLPSLRVCFFNSYGGRLPLVRIWSLKYQQWTKQRPHGCTKTIPPLQKRILLWAFPSRKTSSAYR